MLTLMNSFLFIKVFYNFLIALKCFLEKALSHGFTLLNQAGSLPLVTFTNSVFQLFTDFSAPLSIPILSDTAQRQLTQKRSTSD